MMFSEALQSQAARLLRECRKRGLMLATAESCTGGLIAALLTSVAGSSDVFERGFITYSNAAKQSQLGVKPSQLRSHGAVSPEIAGAMAEGALKNSRAQLAVSVTGIAGPGGGTKEKPVGLVCVAAAARGKKTVVEAHHFKGNREEVRLASVAAALALALALAGAGK